MFNLKRNIIVNLFVLVLMAIVSLPIYAAGEPHVEYAVHVENLGWQDPVQDGNSAGTTGSSLRQEAIRINIVGDDGNPVEGLGVSYRSHVQDEGWQNYVNDGAESGTTGQSKKVEAVQIKLTGEKALDYNILYRTHVENFGWTNWTENGDPSGSEGFNYRIESIEIRLVPAASSESIEQNPEAQSLYTNYGTGNVRYSGHVEEIGWQNYVNDGEESGTTGQNKKLEALIVNLNPTLPEGDILISPHVQDVGWMDYVPSYKIVGTTGQNKRLEAVKIKLTGKLAELYDVYYEAHVQDEGWQGSVKNDEEAGTTGQGLKIEALTITLLPKENESNYDTYINGVSDILKKYPIPENPDTENPFSSHRLLIQTYNGSNLNLRDYGAIDIVNGENGLIVAQFDNETDAKEAYRKLQRNEEVLNVSPDSYITADQSSDENSEIQFSENDNEAEALDTYTPLSWGAKSDKTGLIDLAASINNKDSIKVAVIDSGIAETDLLKNKITYVDGADIVNDDDNPKDDHEFGHGTHIAGTIVDCMPGLNVEIMPIKVTDGKTATGSSISAGVYKAIKNGAKVINISLSGEVDDDEHDVKHDAINKALSKKITVCVSSGNYAGNCKNYCPAHMQGVITVGAVDKDYVRPSFSDYGKSLDLTAPGVKIKSCVPSYVSSNGKKELDGTSFACPHVTAAAAMLLLQDPNRTPKQIKNLLRSNAKDVGDPGWDKYYGAGVLDVHNLAKVSAPNTGVDEGIEVTCKLVVGSMVEGEEKPISSILNTGRLVLVSYNGSMANGITNYTELDPNVVPNENGEVTYTFKPGLTYSFRLYRTNSQGNEYNAYIGEFYVVPGDSKKTIVLLS